MNMTSDVKASYDFFVRYCGSCINTMAQLSQDSTNGVCLVNDSTPAFDFDLIKTRILMRMLNRPMPCTSHKKILSC